MSAGKAFGQSSFADHGAEVQRLRYFLGNWQTERALNPERYGVSKGNGTSHGEVLGGAFIVVTSEEDNPLGHRRQLSIVGYDPVQKAFVWNVFGSNGKHETLHGKVEGKNWTWMSLDRAEVNKKWVYTRYIVTEISPTSCSSRIDVSEDGKEWTNVAGGKATKLSDDRDSGTVNPGP